MEREKYNTLNFEQQAIIDELFQCFKSQYTLDDAETFIENCIFDNGELDIFPGGEPEIDEAFQSKLRLQEED